MDYSPFLSKTLLFHELTPQQLQVVNRYLVAKTYKKNATVFTEGEPADNIFFILYGKVKVFKVSPDGRMHILRIFQTGDSFAEAAMFEGNVYPACCSAIEDTQLLSLARRDLQELLTTDPNIAINMIGVLAMRLKELTKVIEDVTLKETSARFAAYLLNASELKNTFSMDISRTLLAELLGTARENLSRLTRKMVQEKLINIEQQQVTILDHQRLQALAEGKIKLDDLGCERLFK